MKFIYIFLILLPFILLQSCATIINGTQQKVKFTSYPKGAEIYINNKNTHKVTPAKVKVSRRIPKSDYNARNQYVYTFKHEGYNDETVNDKAEFSGVFWLNLVTFPVAPLGMPIDLLSGATKKYDKKIHANLSEGNKTKVDTVVHKEIVYVTKEAPTVGYVFEKKSGVDNDIPEIAKTYNNRYALIIGNEDYSSYQIDLSDEVNVEFARNDASAFKVYAENVLGIPEENIIFMLDATLGKMNQGIAKANTILKVTKGEAEFVVYYAGHGLPDEQTKEPYIMPVDVSGKNASEGISLKNMYTKLTEYPAKRISVFIDACFSGGARNQGLIAARGVKVVPNESTISGNLVVFSASSGEQSSLPYLQESHGMFTYFLLKKLKESKGKITYNDLSSYLIDNVSLKSVLINDKEQTPKVGVSSQNQLLWKDWMVND